MTCHLRSLLPWVGILPSGLCFIIFLLRILEARVLRQCNRVSVTVPAVPPPMAQEPHSNGATGAAVAATEDHPQEGSTDLLSSPPQGTCRWSTNVKVMDRVLVAGAEREPFAEVFFELECVRDETQAKVKLKVDQVDFCVRNCCAGGCPASNQQCNKNCKTVFVRKMTIQARPKSWAQDCRRMQLQPHYEAEVFGLQRSSTFNCQLPFLCPHQASISYQPGNTVSRAAPAFEWIPACRDPASKSVSWIWKLNRYADGSKLKFNSPRWGSRPSLGINPSLMQFTRGSFLAEATWELSPNAEFHQQWLEWDVMISLDIVVLQSKRRLPGYSVTTVPTRPFDRPMQFSKLTKQG